MSNGVLTPEDLLGIRTTADNTKKQRRKAAAQELANIVGVARAKLMGQLDNFMQSGMDSRDYVLLRKWTIASSGGAYKDFTLAANKLSLFSELVNSSFPAQQPTGKLFAIKRLAIFVKTNEKVGTADELLEKWGIRLHYADGRSPLEVPARQLLMTGSRVANAGAAYNAVAAVEGTRTEIIELGNELVLDPEDVNIVAPGDTISHIEGFWLSDYAASPPTTPAGGAPSADIVVSVRAQGRLFSAINRD